VARGTCSTCSTFHRHTDNPNRAHESRTESEAKSMATQVNPLEEHATGAKAGRRSSKAKRNRPNTQPQRTPIFHTLGRRETRSRSWTHSKTRRMRLCGDRICARKTDTMLSLQSKGQFATRTLSPTSPAYPPHRGEGRRIQARCHSEAKKEYCAARQEHTATIGKWPKRCWPRRSTASTPSTRETRFR